MARSIAPSALARRALGLECTIMIIRALIISTTLVLSGCLSNNVLMSSTVAHDNVNKINQLQIGMTQEEVYQIMRYPSTEDQISTNDGCYDIWFYITKSNILDQSRPVARNLTPLIFKDGIFVGRGRSYYNHLVQKNLPPELAPAAIPSEKTSSPQKERENIDLEKTLMPSIPPPKPASEKNNQTPLSMYSKPRQIESTTEENAKDNPNEHSSQPKLDEEDRELLDQEREENFNDW